MTLPHFNDTAGTNASLRIGTRGSALALAQANLTQSLLRERCGQEAEIVTMTTSGDRFLEVPLSEIGGKGLFTKEIDEALLDGRVDLAVHSCKDMPTTLPAGICFGAILEREDPRDVFFSPTIPAFNQLEPGMTVGTASLRRKAQILHHHPAVNVITFRGNVGTRITKLKAGEADGTLLALAGIKRLGLEAQDILPLDVMLPAVAQGAIAIVCRENDTRTRGILAHLHHEETGHCVTAERALLNALDGSCRTPIAGLATLHGDHLRLRGMLAREDATGAVFAERESHVTDGGRMGTELAAELRSMLAA